MTTPTAATTVHAAAFRRRLLRRSAAAAIVIFWCAMNLALLKRELSAPARPVAIAGVQVVSQPIEEWWGVFHRGEKIGYASQTIEPREKSYRIRSHSRLRLNLLGKVQPAETRLDVAVTDEWALETFAFELRSSGIRFEARGRALPGRLDLEISSAGRRSRKTLRLAQRPYLLAALKPYVATQQLEPGREHLFSTFDPATQSQQVTAVVIEGREQIRVGDRLESAIRVRQRFKDIAVVSWLDGTGRTLKEESPAGLSLVRQSKRDAQALADWQAPSLDLVGANAITPDKPIAHPERAARMIVALEGVRLSNFPALASGRQRIRDGALEIRREDLGGLSPLEIPVRAPSLAEFLKPTAFIRSDDAEIRRTARAIIGSERDARKAVLRLQAWVYREIAKEPTVSIPNAVEVLQTKKGDCNEHTVIFNALARAAGIPAKTAVGVVYLNGAFYYHAWSEVWLGRWLSLDSVLDQFPADATHIKFLEGDIDRQVDMLQLMGQLKIAVLEVS